MNRKNFISLIKEDKIIVPLEIDVKFYQNRASRYIDRKNYSKALKCYWKIIDLEPDNPFNYFNIANILTDMGMYKESNDLLLHIVEKLDCDMPECYYFLANNYMFMENPEKALIFILKYIEIVPEGDFICEALEMKMYIEIQSNHSLSNQEVDEEREKVILHNNAKALLDSGKYEEAISKLIIILEIYPDFQAARNNIALAYFYSKKYDEAIEQISIVLEKDFTDIHALCNLTVFYKHLQIKDEYECLLSNLRKLVPYNKEQVYKLATTFAILGEHDLVFKHLSRLINKGVVQDITFMHYCAIAAFNTRHYEYAKKCWEQIYRKDSDKAIANYYLEIVIPFKDRLTDFVLPSSFYQYKLPLDELINIQSNNLGKISTDYIYCSLLWMLINGSKNEKEQIIFALIFFKSDESEQILRNYLLREKEPEDLKKKAIISLEKMNVKLPYSVNIGGEIFRMDTWYPDFKLWKSNWFEVLTTIDKIFSKGCSLAEFYDAKMLWYKFISITYPNIPEINIVNSWVAAIEYIIAEKHNKPVKLEDLSQKYQVSYESILRKVKEIVKKLKINEEKLKLLKDI